MSNHKSNSPKGVVHTSRKLNVCTEVVAKNLCIGCGLCAAICPRQNLKIVFNEFGQYVAHEQGMECSESCRMCLNVCPFFDGEETEDTLSEKLFADIKGIKHTSETGYYLESFVGYSAVNNHRENGASGGLATWMLETLLEKNIVDFVACVSPTQESQRLFKFTICKNSEEVRACSRSCYYPVEMSEIFQHILSHEGKYAVIALPCMCKAIRLAMRHSPKIQRRVKFVLGLTCSQTKGKFFSEYICALGGGNPKYLKKVTFRIKDPNRSPQDFGMEFLCMNDRQESSEGVVFWTEGMGKAWTYSYFTPYPCNFCDDVFAELADVCFMDAWLPQYKSDSRGNTIMLIRNKDILNMVENQSFDRILELRPIKIEQVIQSQSGLIFQKRKVISERLKWCDKSGIATPRKRVSRNSKIRYDYRLETRSKLIASIKTPEAWIKSGKNVREFHKAMRLSRIKLGLIEWSRKIAGKVFAKVAFSSNKRGE